MQEQSSMKGKNPHTLQEVLSTFKCLQILTKVHTKGLEKTLDENSHKRNLDSEADTKR